MKRSIGLWQLMGFAVTSFLGTVLHFLYDWLSKPFWIAPFSGVNESTFEHMKLLFWPMLLFAAVQHRFFKNEPSFWCIKCRGILLGLTLIPVLFYTYNGVIGPSPDGINIAIFFLSAAVAFGYEARQLKQGKSTCRHPQPAVALLLLLAAAFLIFTFVVPPLGLFKDPLSGGYGRGA